MKLIARDKECKQLQKLHASKFPEFLVVYGRRRVGKTFLITEFFKDRIFFSHTGVDPSSGIKQIAAFQMSLELLGMGAVAHGDWLHVFTVLRRKIEEGGEGKKVLFFDEISWIDADKDGFLGALAWFWNSFACMREDILLIACGSSTSWVMEHLIMNTGGLFNRNTDIMAVEPFTLGETEAFLESRGIKYERQTVLELYMIFGGIPYYLNLIDRSLGLPANVDRIVFGRFAPLSMEYDRLYATMFTKYERHHAVVAALAQKSSGLTREEVAKASKLADGGNLSKTLKELEQCGMIRRYFRFGNKERGSRYQLTDPFTLFYHRFVKNSGMAEQFWSSRYGSAEVNGWRGYAFELISLLHLFEIRKALGISGISTDVSSYSAPGAQIDLVIDRTDQIINLCEMKYTRQPYVVNKTVFNSLRNKEEVFVRETKTRKTVHTTLVTPFGLKENEYSHVVQSVVTLNDLFS